MLPSAVFRRAGPKKEGLLASGAVQHGDAVLQATEEEAAALNEELNQLLDVLAAPKTG